MTNYTKCVIKMQCSYAMPQKIGTCHSQGQIIHQWFSHVYTDTLKLKRFVYAFYCSYFPCIILIFMPPTLKKLMGHIAFGASVSAWVRGCVTLFVPTVTFKPLKLES